MHMQNAETLNPGELQPVRARGYAFDKEEASLLANCVSAPDICNASGAAAILLNTGWPSWLTIVR